MPLFLSLRLLAFLPFSGRKEKKAKVFQKRVFIKPYFYKNEAQASRTKNCRNLGTLLPEDAVNGKVDAPVLDPGACDAGPPRHCKHSRADKTGSGVFWFPVKLVRAEWPHAKRALNLTGHNSSDLPPPALLLRPLSPGVLISLGGSDLHGHVKLHLQPLPSLPTK